MTGWVVFPAMQVCRYCDTGQAAGEPFYQGRARAPFCAKCARRIIGLAPPPVITPAAPEPAVEDSAFARLNRAAIAGRLARANQRWEL